MFPKGIFLRQMNEMLHSLVLRYLPLHCTSLPITVLCKNLIAGIGEVDKVDHSHLSDSTKASTQQKISKLQLQLTHLYIPVSSLITVRVELDKSVWLRREHKIGHCNTTAINEDFN